MADTGIPFSSLPETAEINQNDELLLQQEGRTKRISFEKVRGPIDADAANNIDCEVNENTAELTVTLKNKKGETLDEATVSLPNTSNIDCEVDEDTAELTVALKNKAGEVVTSDTVQLPNTSNIDCEVSEDMKLTVSLKNKSGQVVTSDTVQLQSALVPSMTQSEYDDLPEEEKTNGQIREITDAEGFPVPFAILNDEMTTSANVLSAQETENRINDAITENNTYSTEEKIVGTWIDGKPIYRQVIVTTTNMSIGGADLPIPNPYNANYTGEVDEIIELRITPYKNVAYYPYILFYFGNNTNIRIGTLGSNFTLYTGTKFIYEYTKKTD